MHVSEKSLEWEVKPQTATTTAAVTTTQDLQSKVNIIFILHLKGATRVLNIFEIIGVLHYLRTL